MVKAHTILNNKTQHFSTENELLLMEYLYASMLLCVQTFLVLWKKGKLNSKELLFWNYPCYFYKILNIILDIPTLSYAYPKIQI